ncbi:MAG: glycosyltransferase family 4 protein [Chloroflexi bacterium]|nr:glycosyltransferase family 4 protein [Chloroflexota bacterium]
MNVVMLSKACVVGAYQRKLEEIAALGVNLTVVVPPYWQTGKSRQMLERKYERGYRLVVSPMRFNGHFHIHYYPAFARIVAEAKPDIVHIDEEPWDFVTFHAVRAARAAGARPLFFTWQNLQRSYPPPFSWMQSSVFAQCPTAIAGNADAVGVLRAKGYTGAAHVIPQFGVDTTLFQPAATPKSPGGPFVIGYAGRLVPEKGVDALFHAAAGLDGNWQVRLLGDGPERPSLLALAQSLGMAARVEFLGRVPSTQTAAHYTQMDALVLPSRRMPNWSEQFGRVLVEAMACGVPVVGSNCGEIPNVIGDAGLTFPQDDISALRAHLARLMGNSALHADLRARGRARVMERFTMQRIARQTVDVYRTMRDGNERR